MKMAAGTQPGNSLSVSADAGNNGRDGDDGHKRPGGTPVVAVAPAGNGSIAHSSHKTALFSGN